MSPAGGCSRTTPPSKYPMGAVSRRPAAELLSLLPSLSAPSGVRLAGYLQLTHGWCRRSRSGGKTGERAADGVRHPGGSLPGPGGVAGPPLRAVTRLLRPAQVDDGLASSSARAANRRPASRNLVRADGPGAWRLQSSAGTATSGDRLGGAGGARTLAPAALDVMPGGHVQDVHDLPAAKVGGQVACQDGAQHAAGWGGAHVPRALCRGRCDGRAVYGCFLCPLDTSPTPSSSVQPLKPLG